MAHKEFRGPTRNGKGKRPVMGYNYKNWYANVEDINWGRPKKDTTNESTASTATTGSISKS